MAQEEGGGSMDAAHRNAQQEWPAGKSYIPTAHPRTAPPLLITLTSRRSSLISLIRATFSPMSRSVSVRCSAVSASALRRRLARERS